MNAEKLLISWTRGLGSKCYLGGDFPSSGDVGEVEPPGDLLRFLMIRGAWKSGDVALNGEVYRAAPTLTLL